MTVQPLALGAITPTRERLIFALYEAAELEHNLMCTYLYAAFSLKSGEAEGLQRRRGRSGRALAPRDPRRRDRGDGPSRRGLEHHVRARRRAAFRPRQLPARSGRAAGRHRRQARAVQRETLQHFVHLERPHGSTEPEGEGFAPRAPVHARHRRAAADADADRLRDRRRVLRRARHEPARFAERDRRERRVLRRSGAAAVAGRGRRSRAPSR